MSETMPLRIVPLAQATRRSLPQGEYYHFLVRNVPMMTRVVLKPGAKTGVHLHQAEEQTYYIIKGQGRLSVGDLVYDVAAQTAVVIPPGQTHALENVGDSELEYIMQYLWPGEAAMPVYPESEQ